MNENVEITAPSEDADTRVFENLESEVQSYARNFPVVFEKAEGSYLYDRDGGVYLDFLSGAGSLNYGHNHPVIREALVEYIQGNGVTMGLDLHTVAKESFLAAMNELIFEPRKMDVVVQFTGPTGTNAVEAALKLARNVKKRHNILCFTNGFHGVSVGAMAATGNAHHRDASGIPLTGTTFMPYDGYLGADVDTLTYIEKMLQDQSSGIDHPAAVIVETVQGEGGLNAARFAWLRGLEALCRKFDMLMIVDDIQAGCGRTGQFFSFDEAGIRPDIITLSKSLSAYGLPFAVCVLRSDIDQWKPGEHNGTFRGNNHAFVTAAAALRHFWSDDSFARDVRRKGELLGSRLDEIVSGLAPNLVRRKGRGMMQGLGFANPSDAHKVARTAWDAGLIIETSGPQDEVVKCLPALTISDESLAEGLDILSEAVRKVMDKKLHSAA